MPIGILLFLLDDPDPHLVLMNPDPEDPTARLPTTHLERGVTTGSGGQPRPHIQITVQDEVGMPVLSLQPVL